MKLTEYIGRFIEPARPFEKGELDLVLLFSEPDLFWDSSDFENYEIIDKPEPVTLSDDLKDRNELYYENPIFRRIRMLLDINIDVGKFCSDTYEMTTMSSPERGQYVAYQIFRSTCLRNAIMLDNYYDPTDQLDFMMLGLICPEEIKDKLYILLKELISTAYTINKFCKPMSWFEKLDQSMIGEGTRASTYFPVRKIRHKKSYKIVPKKNLAQKTTFKIDRNGRHSPFVLTKATIFHD